MATLKVANVHFDIAGTNRLEYLGGNVITFNSTGSVKVPTGTTAQRPTGTPGLIRFNSQTGTFEGYNTSHWGAIGGEPDTTLPLGAFAKANASFTHANLAFNKANSANILAQSAETRSISGFAFANTVNAYSFAGRAHANAAFGVANTANSVAQSASFPSGTRMLFAQAAAPTGWTRDTTNFNNHALRVVTGASGGSSGGSLDFTAAFASRPIAGSVSVSGTVGATTLTISQIPAHTHSYDRPSTSATADDGSGRTIFKWQNYTVLSTTSEGGGGSHTHSWSGSASFTGTNLNMAVKYLDIITATKD